mgnify:CR=1 FL=1
MVEQKRRCIDQGPGKVLRGGEAFVLLLGEAHVGVDPKLGELRIEGHRQLGLREGSF